MDAQHGKGSAPRATDVFFVLGPRRVCRLSSRVVRPVPLLALAACALAQPARAQNGQPTPLVQDDLQRNKRTTIDQPDDLDGIAGAIGGGGFSTATLQPIEQRLRASLRAERPRATPRLIVFLYPGRVSAENLRNLSQVYVDIELDIDPCDRSVCRDAVGKHIELVGRAVGKPVYANQNFKLTFKNLTLKTATQMHDTEVSAYQIPISEAVAASARSGGGLAWLDGAKKAEDQYVPLMVRAVAQKASAKRVSLEGAPQVSRSGSEAHVVMKVRGDRARVEQQVTDALAAAESALRESRATPSIINLEVDLEGGPRGATRKFRALGNPVGEYLDGRLDARALWASYVEEVKKQAGAQRMDFGDTEAAGGAIADSPANPDEAVATLAANFPALGACTRVEAARDKRFRGVTITFSWKGDGTAQDVSTKEAQLRGGPLATCLKQALSSIRLPRFSGAPQKVEYPIAVKR
jgi:hypothetical protein